MARRRRGTRQGQGGGPKTEQGKAVVRLNPVRHGVLSQTPVLPLVERQEDWDRLCRELREYWQPDGFEEEHLVGELAVTYWRKARSRRFESESIMVNLRDVPRDWWLGRSLQGLPVPDELTEEAVSEMDAMLALRLMPSEEVLGKLVRYETMLDRQAAHIRQQLITLKSLRDPKGRWRVRPAVAADPEFAPQQPRDVVTGRFMKPPSTAADVALGAGFDASAGGRDDDDAEEGDVVEGEAREV